jgi:hypothetical protein
MSVESCNGSFLAKAYAQGDSAAISIRNNISKVLSCCEAGEACEKSNTEKTEVDASNVNYFTQQTLKMKLTQHFDPTKARLVELQKESRFEAESETHIGSAPTPAGFVTGNSRKLDNLRASSGDTVVGAISQCSVTSDHLAHKSRQPSEVSEQLSFPTTSKPSDSPGSLRGPAFEADPLPVSSATNDPFHDDWSHW